MASSQGTVIYSSPVTVVYDPKAFILHAALLRQACAHCGRFSTAASRRSLGSVSVPVWLIILSDQLPVIALVSHYLTNKLIGREPIPERRIFSRPRMRGAATSGISHGFPWLSRVRGQVTHALLTLAPLSGGPKPTAPLDLHA